MKHSKQNTTEEIIKKIINKDSTAKSIFTLVFSRYFATGFILVFLGFALSQAENYVKLPLASLAILPGQILSTIGVSLLVGSIVSFSIDTPRFVQFITNILAQVVVSKNYLEQLNSQEKLKILRSLLLPTTELTENGRQYFNEHVNKFYKLFDENFRDDVSIILNCKYDSDTNIVKVEGTLRFTIYKYKSKFDPMTVRFVKGKGKLIETTISPPEGEPKEIQLSEPEDEELSGQKYIKYEHSIPEHFNQYSTLRVFRRFEEYGLDHWQLWDFQVFSPTHGIDITAQCSDDLQFKDYLLLDHDANYSIKLHDDRKRMEIRTNNWVKPGVGIGILIAQENTHRD